MNERDKPSRGRPRKMDADNTLDVAMRAYWGSDPADVSVNAICGLAGVSKPALYREFGSEDGLMLAVLNRYADQVLSDLFEPIHQSLPLDATLEALFVFAAEDPKMEKGCVFYKMRAGKHRLGPDTLARVQALDAGAVDAFTQYLEARRMAGDWVSTLSAEQGARYLVEQIGLALTQRAAGEDPGMVRDMLKLALSAIKPK